MDACAGNVTDVCKIGQELLMSVRNFSQLVLQHHFQPKVITIAERFKFHQRSQADGESVVDYMAKLRHLASTCDFGRFLDQALIETG